MMYQIKAGTVDVSVVIRIIDSADGTPETGVVFNTSGIDLEYRREGAASTDITEATLAALTTAHTDGGFLHIGNGYYRLDLPDAACASGATGVLVHGTVTGMVVIGCYIQLVAYDPFDTVRLGLTAMPNVASGSAGAIVTSGTGTAQLSVSSGLVTLAGVTHTNAVIPTVSTVNGLAAGVITAAAVATGAIDADALAADAVAEIADGVWDEDATGHQTQGTFGQAIGDPVADADTIWGLVNTNLNATVSSRASQTSVDTIGTNVDAILVDTGTTLQAELDGIQADTEDIQSRLPAALVSGRIDASVGAVAANAINAAALAADVTTELRALVSGTADSGTTTTMVDAARTEADTDYWAGNYILFTSGTISGQARLITGFTPGTDTISFSPATTQAVGTNTYEIIPNGRVDLALWLGSAPNALSSGRVDSSTGAMAAGVVTAAAVATDAIDADAIAANAVTEIQSGLATSAALSTVSTNVDSILADTGTDGVVVAAASKSGYALSTAGLADFFDTNSGTTYGSAVAGSVVKEIADNAGGSALTEAGIADAVWDEALAGHLSAGSTGEALDAAGTAGDPWITALPGAYGAGTAGKILGDNLNATVSSRATQTSVDAVDDLIDTEVAAIKSDTAAILADTGTDGVVVASINAGVITAAAIATNAIDADAIAADAVTEIQVGLATAAALTTVDDFLDTEIAAIKAKTDNLPAAPAATGDIPSAATIADAVWDEDATAHQTQGTFGQAIGDPGADSDTIWALANTNLNATVSSRASQTSVDTIDDMLDTEVAAIKADTAAILADTGTDGVVVASINAGAITASAIGTGAVDADALASDAVTEIVTGVLTTAITEAYASVNAAPTVSQALMLIQQTLGDFSISGTTLTVRKLDGTTAATFTLNDNTSPTAIERTT